MYPSSSRVLTYLRKAGSVSAREAIIDLDMTSASLAKRMCELEESGYVIRRARRKHPVSGRRYTRYSLAG